jgi:septal ring factor EnvC (AmiA/AmiB activator)
MKKGDLNEIKDVIDSVLETHLASVHEEITELRTEMDTEFAAVEKRMDRLDAKIDHIDEKLGGFENHEVDKRLQLEVRVGHLEKQRS